MTASLFFFASGLFVQRKLSKRLLERMGGPMKQTQEIIGTVGWVLSSASRHSSRTIYIFIDV